MAGVTKSNVLDLLRARCEQPVAADDMRTWMASRQGADGVGIWFVGGEQIAVAAREQEASALIVSELLEPQCARASG